MQSKCKRLCENQKIEHVSARRLEIEELSDDSDDEDQEASTNKQSSNNQHEDVERPQTESRDAEMAGITHCNESSGPNAVEEDSSYKSILIEEVTDEDSDSRFGDEGTSNFQPNALPPRV